MRTSTSTVRRNGSEQQVLMEEGPGPRMTSFSPSIVLEVHRYGGVLFLLIAITHTTIHHAAVFV